MKNYTLILAVFFTLTGCVSRPLSSTDIKSHNDEFNTAFGFVNKKIWGNMMSENQNDLTSIEYSQYLQQLNSIQSKMSKKVEKELKEVDEYLFKPVKESFIICVKSVTFQYAVCDDGYTPATDRDKRELPLPDLGNLLKEIS